MKQKSLEQVTLEYEQANYDYKLASAYARLTAKLAARAKAKAQTASDKRGIALDRMMDTRVG